MANKSQPYVGPRPFERRDQTVYFGRNREAIELHSLIIAHEAVLIYAPSGAGKTSLINAKLIPRLEEDGVEMLPVARVGGLIHEDIDLEEIPNPFVFNTLVSWTGEKLDPKQLTYMSLGDYLNSLEHPTIIKGLRSPRVAIFDQFEELFYSHQERWGDRKNFFEQVASALEADPLLRVVFVIREDYLAQLDPYTALLPEKLRTRYRIERLDQEAALLAVEEPLRETDRHFKKGVAEKLVNDLRTIPVTTVTGKTKGVTGEFVEPVQLQVVCTSLWESLPDDIKEITKDHLKASGDVTQALSQYYEQSIQAACEETEVTCGILRKWFEDTLITPASTRGMVYRGAEETAGIPNAIIDALEKRYIIRGEMRGGARWYELTHDRFIEPVLDSNEKWRSTQRGAEQTRDRLEEMASLWVRQGRGNDGLLEKAELGRMESWLASSEAAEVGCSEELKSFVEYNRAAIDKANKQRELEQARADAEEQHKRAKEEAETSLRLRRRSRALLIMSLLAVCATGIATWRWIEADSNARLAGRSQRTSFSRELAAAAISNLQKDSGLGRLLALHAAALDQPTEVEEALHLAVAASRVRLTIFAHIDQSLDVAYSLDGKRIATCGDDNTARVWDAQNGEELLTLSGHTGSVRGVTFSPDGEHIATCGDDYTARVWDAQTGEVLDTLSGHTGAVLSITYSPDSTRVATASLDSTARVWDAQNGEKLLTLSDHTGWVRGVAFSPDGEHIATCGDDNTARVWDAQTGEELLTLSGHTDWVRGVAFSPDGELIATCGDDYAIKVWDAQTGKESFTLTLVDYPSEDERRRGFNDVAFNSNGLLLASGDIDGVVRIWDMRAHKELYALYDHTASITGVAFCYDRKQLASASRDGTVSVSQVPISEELPTLTGHTDWVRGVAFSPDGERMATCGDDNTARVWDAKTGEELLTLSGHTYWAMDVAYSPDGTRIATASLDSTAMVWDAQTGKVLDTLSGHTAPVYDVAYSPDGTRIATASRDSTAMVWDAQTGKVLDTLSCHTGAVLSITYSPDGTRVATASLDSTARVWDAQNGEKLLTLSDHTGWVRGVAFSPDGERIATCGDDNTARVWDAQTGEELRTLHGHNRLVFSVAFHPLNGRHLATSSLDGTAKIWDLETGMPLFNIFMAPGDTLLQVTFDSDGENLAIASSNGTVRQFVYEIKDLIKLERGRVTRLLTSQEVHHYLHNPDYEAYLYDDKWPLTAASLSLGGRNQAVAGDVESAILIFRRALELDTTLNSTGMANTLVAAGGELARDGRVKEAITAYIEAQKIDSTLEISARSWNTLCWFGSLYGAPSEVIFAGEQAVELEPDNGNYRDTRGLARALLGDYLQAIEDFKFFIEWAGKNDAYMPYIQDRKDWIATLEAGQNPFDKETLEAQLGE